MPGFFVSVVRLRDELERIVSSGRRSSRLAAAGSGRYVKISRKRVVWLREKSRNDTSKYLCIRGLKSSWPVRSQLRNLSVQFL